MSDLDYRGTFCRLSSVTNTTDINFLHFFYINLIFCLPQRVCKHKLLIHAFDDMGEPIPNTIKIHSAAETRYSHNWRKDLQKWIFFYNISLAFHIALPAKFDTIFIFCAIHPILQLLHLLPDYRKNPKIWDTSNNFHNCPKNRKV